MEISAVEGSYGTEIPTQDLLSHLSQVVLTMIDEEAKRKYEEMQDWKNKIQTLKSSVAKEKKVLQDNSSELARMKALGRVLGILSTLKERGVLSGQNGRKILSVLESIETKDFHALRILEERLGAYLPDR